MDIEARVIKTYKQQELEIRNHGKDWRVILRECLEKHRGQRNIINLVAADLGISHQTVYEWCRDLGINVADYR